MKSRKLSRRGAMALTPALVARVERIEPDPGPEAGADLFEDADFDRVASRLIAECGDGPFWIFAYGSLIWKPEIDFVEQRNAIAHGWHRSFCLQLTRWRGTREYPGLMMALDQGGACHGVILRLADHDRFDQLNRLLRREIDQDRDVGTLRWLNVSTAAGRVRALTFYAGPRGSYYSGKLPDAEVARILARAAGHWGSCASYLFNTITKLEEFGIHDSHLWQLQKLVAEEIERATGRD